VRRKAGTDLFSISLNDKMQTTDLEPLTTNTGPMIERLKQRASVAPVAIKLGVLPSTTSATS
jgi:hypothetical protein